VKLLFDHNLSPRLVPALSAEYPGSTHTREAGLERASDQEIWDFAKARGFAIVSKDSDFLKPRPSAGATFLRPSTPETQPGSSLKGLNTLRPGRRKS
jgi:predicted nuclease of predicted toxin-antitoxin system